MDRYGQYRKFNKMVAMLLQYCEFRDIPIRMGEVHRPKFVAERYAQQGKGIINSKHRYSLAVDIWIASGTTGKRIDYKDVRYDVIADFWRYLGGEAGYYWKRKDRYHLEIKGPVL